MEALPLESLPIGFRFRPTDEELVNHYLRSKINGDNDAVSVIREVDVCKYEPSDLPDKSRIKTTDDEWFFFCPKDRKYQNGQRLNRATVSGYWKATGKDRMVKSLKGRAVIGMKKTLVFYTGRAPNGQRTNWVIHEYRATCKELDGTKPGQGSYVLCKLIKKHDEKLDGKSKKAVEEKVDSPPTVESNTEDVKSEPVTPIPSAQGEKLPSSIDRDLVEHFDRRPQDAQPEWPSSSSVSDDLAYETGDKKIMQPDPEIEELLKMFKVTYGDDKIFSPLHTHMLMDLEASCGLRYPDPNNDTGHCHEGQYGSNEEEMDKFLDSVLISDEQSYENCDNYTNGAIEFNPPHINLLQRVYVNETGSCSESEAEVAQAEFPGDFEGYGQIQQNIEREPPVYMTMSAGTHQSSCISYGTDQRVLQSEYLGQNFLTASSASAQLYANSPQESTNNNSISVESDVLETGIRIRTRQPPNRPIAQISEPQGSAPRRLRLQKKLQVGSLYCTSFEGFSSNEKNDEAKLTVAKAGEDQEELVATVATASIVAQGMSLSKSAIDAEEVAGESSMNMKSGSCFPPGSDKGVSSAARKISSSVYLLSVLVILGLAVALVGICYTFEF